jgi:hypothetical protein
MIKWWKKHLFPSVLISCGSSLRWHLQTLWKCYVKNYRSLTYPQFEIINAENFLKIIEYTNNNLYIKLKYEDVRDADTPAQCQCVFGNEGITFLVELLQFKYWVRFGLLKTINLTLISVRYSHYRALPFQILAWPASICCGRFSISQKTKMHAQSLLHLPGE